MKTTCRFLLGVETLEANCGWSVWPEGATEVWEQGNDQVRAGLYLHTGPVSPCAFPFWPVFHHTLSTLVTPAAA